MIHSIMEEHIFDNKLLPFIFHSWNAGAESPTYINWHENIEVLCCNRGKGIYHCNGIEYEMSEGDTCLIGSMVVHGPQPLTDNFRCYCLIIDKAFCIKNAIHEHKLFFTGMIRNEDIRRHLQEIDRCYRNREELYELSIRMHVIQILYILYHNSASFAILNNSSPSVETIRGILTYINQHYCEKITLEDISRYVGLNRFHLTRIFKEATGKTIFEYLNMVRCQEAKQMIEAGESISKAAIECGFRNLSYFSKTYKKVVGYLPSQRTGQI